MEICVNEKVIFFVKIVLTENNESHAEPESGTFISGRRWQE